MSSSLKVMLGLYLLNIVIALDFDCTDIPQGLLNIHPTDCRGFVVCIGGNPQATTCPSDMYFDFERQSCMTGYCENDTTTEVITTSEETTFFTTTAESETTDEQLTTTEETSTVTIPEEISTTEAIPDETTTTEETSTATIPEEIPTTEAIPDETSTTETSPGETSTTEETTTDDTTTVSTSTTEEITDVQTSTAQETTFELTSTTEESAESGEVDEDGIPVCNTTIYMYYLPHPYKCRYFILCLAGNRYISPCPTYKSWDVNLVQCVDSSLVTCAEGAQ